MTLINVLYDLTSATVGAVFGALIMLMFGWRKTKKMSNQIVLGRRELDRLRLENDRLMKDIRDKENQILAFEKKILNKKNGGHK